MGQKTIFSKKSKRGYKRLFFICLRQMSNERIQTSIIHIPPCSQKIIDNENPDFFTLFVLKMRLFGCYGNNNCFCFHGNHGHCLSFHCFQLRSWHLIIKLVIRKSLWPKENLIWNAFNMQNVLCLRMQTSIIHIPPCSQKIIDNENPDFFLHCFFEDAKWGCLVAMVTMIFFHGNHGHYLNIFWEICVAKVQI
jgi:hypothetical protein